MFVRTKSQSSGCDPSLGFSHVCGTWKRGADIAGSIHLCEPHTYITSSWGIHESFLFFRLLYRFCTYNSNFVSLSFHRGSVFTPSQYQNFKATCWLPIPEILNSKNLMMLIGKALVTQNFVDKVHYVGFNPFLDNKTIPV